MLLAYTDIVSRLKGESTITAQQAKNCPKPGELQTACNLAAKEIAQTIGAVTENLAILNLTAERRLELSSDVLKDFLRMHDLFRMARDVVKPHSGVYGHTINIMAGKMETPDEAIIAQLIHPYLPEPAKAAFPLSKNAAH